jgi:hypothetical protein
MDPAGQEAKVISVVSLYPQLLNRLKQATLPNETSCERRVLHSTIGCTGEKGFPFIYQVDPVPLIWTEPVTHAPGVISDAHSGEGNFLVVNPHSAAHLSGLLKVPLLGPNKVKHVVGVKISGRLGIERQVERDVRRCSLLGDNGG